jgi:DNA-directed RNA polymerase subunit RPC12/RpoP
MESSEGQGSLDIINIEVEEEECVVGGGLVYAFEEPSEIISDTFKCGACLGEWNHLASFLEHKQQCGGKEAVLMLANAPDHHPDEDDEPVATPDITDKDDNVAMLEEQVTETFEIVTDGDDFQLHEEVEEEEDKPVADEIMDQPALGSTAKLGKYTCSECGKSFKKGYNLKQHLLIHLGEKPYKCPSCSKSFTQKSNLTKHLASHKVSYNLWGG